MGSYGSEIYSFPILRLFGRLHLSISCSQAWPDSRQQDTTRLHLHLLTGRFVIDHGYQRLRCRYQTHVVRQEPTHLPEHLLLWHCCGCLHLYPDELLQQGLGSLFNQHCKSHLLCTQLFSG